MPTDLSVPTTDWRAVRRLSGRDASYWPQLTVAAHLQKKLERVVGLPGFDESLAQSLPRSAFIKGTLFMIE